MIKEFYIDTFKDGVSGWVIGIIWWISTLLIIGLIGCGLFYLIDSCLLATQTSMGEVVSKWMIPSHYNTTYVQSGKVMIPITTHIPDAWSLNISICDLTDVVNVSEYTYNTISIGQELECEYVTGRVSGSVYIEAINSN